MNPRILELVTAPQNIQIEDLQVLKSEIQNKPYIQSIRALYLYGIHIHQPENYKSELTTTAAYTTDKKILYQFINGKIQEEKSEAILEKTEDSSAPLIVENVTEKDSVLENVVEENTVVEEISNEKPMISIGYNKQPFPLPKTENKPVFIDGKQNRILFEGEEDFLNKENSQIVDVESSLESGTLVVTSNADVKKEETTTIVNEVTEEIQNSNENNDLVLNPKSEILEVEESPEVVAESKEKVEGIEVVDNKKEVEFKTPEIQEPTPDVIINEENIDTPKEEAIVEDNSELSFHGLDSFMPNVEIPAARSEIKTEVAPNDPPTNKHEEEMKRLIEEVERKMKEKKLLNEQKQVVEKDVVEDNHGEINFSQTQEFFVVEKEEILEHEVKADNEDSIINEEKIEDAHSEEEAKLPQSSKVEEIEKIEAKSAWKPMNFNSNAPDSSISKPKIVEKFDLDNQSETIANKEREESQIVEKEEKQLAELATAEENNLPKNEEDIPVMNLSFFSSDISQLPVAEKQASEPVNEFKDDKLAEIKKETVSEKIVENVSSIDLDSNVPSFINTWQSWLKIDRSEEIEKEKFENKNKAIEAFIENNPKISQLKDEVTFVAKEKTDDISHLMTETLANLYVEQKLYAKSIKAFQLLANKFPEKKSYFEEKIEAIKESRSRN